MFINKAVITRAVSLEIDEYTNPKIKKNQEEPNVALCNSLSNLRASLVCLLGVLLKDFNHKYSQLKNNGETVK